MIGRGMRLHPGKENCHIIDMVSSLETGIMTTPSLFGLDPDELVDKASPQELSEMKERKEQGLAAQKPPPARVGSLAFTEYDSVFDLLDDTSSEKHIRTLSANAWVQVGAERYILSGPSGTYLRIERAEDDGPDAAPFKGLLVRALPPGLAKSPFAKPREILTAANLTDAVHGCDKYAKESADGDFPHAFVAKRMPWRLGPPTAGQLKMLNKLRSKDDQLQPGDINKGKASDMITKLKHGARGRFSTMEAVKKRHARVIAQEEREARLRDASVTVGPVLDQSY